MKNLKVYLVLFPAHWILELAYSCRRFAPANFALYILVNFLFFISIIYRLFKIAFVLYVPDCQLDIVFIMEDTDELTVKDFNDMKSFFVSLVSRMIIGDTAIKVGVVTYADGAATAFPLNQYSTGNGIITGITNINQGSSAYSRVGRYVDKALKHTQMNFFTTGNGDRLNAANYYIFLTHGHSAGTKAAAFGSAIRSIASSNIFIIGKNTYGF